MWFSFITGLNFHEQFGIIVLHGLIIIFLFIYVFTLCWQIKPCSACCGVFLYELIAQLCSGAVEDYSRGWVSLQYSIRSSHLQGSKKVPSGLSGQVDLPAGQVTFQSHLPDLQGIGLVIYQLNQSKSKLRLMHRTSKIWESLLVSKASGSSSFFQAPIYVEIVPLLINKPP